MAMPTAIQIGPYSYTVSSDPLAMHAANKEGGRLFGGQIRLRDGVILIEPGQSVSRQRETMLHEVLHGCFDHAQLDTFLGEKEEETISRLSPVLLDTLRRNPDLIAYLLSTGG